jgi:hypothetical protein
VQKSGGGPVSQRSVSYAHLRFDGLVYTDGKMLPPLPPSSRMSNGQETVRQFEPGRQNKILTEAESSTRLVNEHSGI